MEAREIRRMLALPSSWIGDSDMANGNGEKMNAWDVLYRLSQIAVLPLLAALVYFMTQINALDRRFSVMEAKMSMLPVVSASDAARTALIEERQQNVIRRLDTIEKDLREHREKSPYDLKR